MSDRYVVVRAVEAGVFYGVLRERDRANAVVVLDRCQRIHHWRRAASVTQIAAEGLRGGDHRVTPPLPTPHEIAGVCEVLEATPKAIASMAEVETWTR